MFVSSFLLTPAIPCCSPSVVSAVARMRSTWGPCPPRRRSRARSQRKMLLQLISCCNISVKRAFWRISLVHIITRYGWKYWNLAYFNKYWVIFSLFFVYIFLVRTMCEIWTKIFLLYIFDWYWAKLLRNQLKKKIVLEIFFITCTARRVTIERGGADLMWRRSSCNYISVYRLIIFSDGRSSKSCVWVSYYWIFEFSSNYSPDTWPAPGRSLTAVEEQRTSPMRDTDDRRRSPENTHY